MLRMSSSSLWKRKFRTVLTVLGVVIGTASIVVMISLGLGLNRATMEQIEQSGGLTTIQVMEGYGGSSASGGAVSVMISGTSSSDDQVNRLDDSVVEMLKGLEHVESVVPILQVSAIGKYGPYEAYLNIQGMPAEGLKELNIQVGEGHLPTDSSELEFFYGNQVAADFYNPKTYEYPYYETGEYAVDFMKDTVFIIFDQQAYYASQNQNQNPGQDSGTSVQPPKKYIIPTAGVEKPNDENTWSSYGYRVLCDLDALKTTLKRVFRNKAIPGQPTTSSGKPYKDIYYSEVDVNVDDIDHVKEVQELIQSMGYQTYSNAEWVQSTQQQYANIQAMLGGIGAVSLLVAAIGITNTMMMSIYERTKEIGVMKVLGCDMGDIRNMFLMESGFIGLMGGVAGLVLSYGLSYLMNHLPAVSQLMMGGMDGDISRIPLWLAASALVFAVVVGMAAGFFPAVRAMKLSPLAAIRNE